MSENRTHLWRYMTVAVIFCLISVIYLGRLFYIQISGRDDGYDGGTTVRTVTIQAVRGEIYDRNGRALVSNRYSYDLTLPYAAFSAMDLRSMNRTALQLLKALDANPEAGKNLHEERFFPLEGAYPYYTFSTEATDGESVIYYRLQRVLSDLGLKKGTTEEELVGYFVEHYELLMKDSDGKRLFNDNEIDRLLRLYYDMSAVRFRASGEYTLAENISLPAMTYIKELALDGNTFRVNAERVYNYPGIASHILGTVGPIYSEEWDYYNEQGYQMSAIVGKSGCEAAFESYLHGRDGQMEIEIDAAGNVVRSEILLAPVAGSDVYLTIDIDLQIAAEKGLAENVQYVVDRANGVAANGAGCNAGAAVVMDPEDFSVLALASYPSYDLATYNLYYNSLATDEAKPLINRALNGLYEPGSTYKLGVAVAALMENKINAGDTVACGGTYMRYDDYQPKCSTHPHAYGGYLNVREAIADSCNVFFYEMGYRLKIDRLNDYMKHFGFGQSTGLELGGAVGALANPDFWSGDEVAGLTLQSAIGQADTRVSPVQLAAYIGTLVNGGTRYSAHLLDRVCPFGSETPTVTSTPTELDRIALDGAALAEVKGGMQMVVRDNATVSRNLSRVTRVTSVGGKTGTAQNSQAADNALFVCAAPLDAPELVITVVLEQGYGGSYASLTAARILECYYGIE